jgi:hypothetical protein
MNRRQLVDTLSTTLLWEVVCANIEKVNQLPIILKDIGYVEDIDNVIKEITQCEVFDSEPLEVINFDKHEESILITFEMSFTLSTWIGQQQLLRITAVVMGKCRIPDIREYEWESIDFESMGKKELLSYEGLVHILELNYSSAECDDVSMLN